MSAGIGRGGVSVSSVFNGCVKGCEGGAARMMRRVERGVFGVGGALSGSVSGLSVTSARKSIVAAISWQCSLEKVKCGLIPFPLSTIVAKDASFGE